MKGSLHTDEFMGAIVHEEKLHTSRRMSHVFVIDAPDYPRPLFVTDAALNLLTGGILDGPLALDNAVSEEACKTKGIVSPVGGRADILVVPDIEAGNMLAKQIEYLAEAQIAGIVLGARVPIIILTSRVDKTPRAARLMRDRAAAGAPRDRGEVLTGAILVLNAGSSSIKFSLFPGEQRPTRQDLFCEGECAGLGDRVHFTAKDGAGAPLLDEYLNQGATHEDALAALLHWIGDRFPQHRLIAAGHRVVHGGALYKGPVLIDAEVIAELTRLVPLAPLHQPHHLAAIAALSKLHPTLPQVACFDTSFHHTQPEVAAAFALPRRLTDRWSSALRVPRSVLRIHRKRPARDRRLDRR